MKIITLTSDFGTRDGYIGAIKGVITSHSPDVQIVNISHDIKPYNIGQAAFCIFSSHSWFPAGTVHIVIVDPGVGSNRKILLLKANDQVFIGPDNGIFDPIVYLHQEFECCEILPDKFVNVSHTFHGRDIFVPAALKYLNGENIDNFCKPVDYSYRLLTSEMMDGSIAVVLHTDQFGNIITALSQTRTMEREIEGLKFNNISIPFVQYYNEGEPGKPVCIFGSSGLLEIAIREDNAAEFFHNRWGGLPTEFEIIWK